MRSCRWLSWWTALALVMFGAAARAAQAAPPAVPVDGEADRLLVSPLPYPAPLRRAADPRIEAARNLPAARTAVARMVANGYARTPEYDAAQSRDDRAFVALAFGDPASADHAPIVIVATEGSGALQRTWVAGGVFRMDAASGQVSLAADVPEANQFVVRVPAGGPTDSGMFADAEQGHHSVRDWMACSIIGCGAAVGGCLKLGAVLPVPPQARVGCAIAGCGILSFLCLW